MALYDNSHWLLTHIRDSFIYTDKSGKAENAMVKDDFPRTLQRRGALYIYPGAEESDEDFEDLPGSSDIEIGNLDKEYSYRQRTNTAQRLEKMDLERKKASKIKHIKWEYNPNNISLEEQKELFKKKDLHKTSENTSKRSLLSEQLEKYKNVPLNPFMIYAKFDGDIQIGVPVKRIKIFICMLPTDQRSYPLHVAVTTNAKVEEFIGLICYKFFNNYPEIKLQQDISKYGLYMAEDDGEVDRDFPCLDPKEVIAKFDFSTLGLVELKPSERALHSTIKTILENKEENEKSDKMREERAKDLAKMAVHTNAMEAPLYQLYRVYIINKVRAKTEVHLGISGEKVEIDPVFTGKGASRFWHRQRAVNYHIDNVASCELTENKGSKTTFTLVYSPHTSITLDGLNVSISHTQSLRRSASFKTHDFEAESSIAEEIVQKINHILELKNSTSRKEYLAQKERKALRRKSFHIHR